MEWLKLLNSDRFGAGGDESSLDYTRTDFQRDYDRLVFSSAFRRLQNKTQVFPLPGSVFVHNRLTHSLEVSSVGRSLGNRVVDKIMGRLCPEEQAIAKHIPVVVSAACLAHDMGNPPFGHNGEEAIRQYFMEHESRFRPIVDGWEWNDLICYEGNANALRLLTQQLNGRRAGGYRLSNAVLASVVKYPYSSTADSNKFGFFKSESDVFAQIASSVGIRAVEGGKYQRHPLVYLVEAADDICYQIMDIEDAHKLGILSTAHTLELYRAFFNADDPYTARMDATLREVTDPNERVAYLRASVIGRLVENCSDVFVNSYSALMQGDSVGHLIDGIPQPQKGAFEAISRLAVEKVYRYSKVVEIEIASYRIVGALLDTFCGAVLNPKSKPNKKVMALIPAQYQIDGNSDYQKIMSVLDFVSGMTDDYALKLYRLFQGIDLPSL